MNILEQTVQRKLTHEFIMTMPVTITLRPRNKVKTPAGGFTWQETVPRAAQVMRLCEPSTMGGGMPRPIVTTDGIQREIEFMLLGEWDASIGVNDVFTHDGHDWEIVQVAQSNGWEQRALVTRLG